MNRQQIVLGLIGQWRQIPNPDKARYVRDLMRGTYHGSPEERAACMDAYRTISQSLTIAAHGPGLAPLAKEAA